jgi:hypothetical protein
MKAIMLRQPGGPSALEYVEAPRPVPSEDEVLVKADTIGVSMPEVLVRKGVYNWMPPLPAIPGDRDQRNRRRRWPQPRQRGRWRPPAPRSGRGYRQAAAKAVSRGFPFIGSQH